MNGSSKSANKLPRVFVFNPFAEGVIARGKGFVPVRHQAMLANDLANLPQFLCGGEDVVLVAKQPSPSFQESLKRAGFKNPRFVELEGGQIPPTSDLLQRKLGGLRPWAWGPDSISLFEPVMAQVEDGKTGPEYFNQDIARLYSKAWSADFLREILSYSARQSPSASAWLCSEQETGVAVNTLEDARRLIASIRSRGHQRVIAKEVLGMAGHNAIRLWEPELLPAQEKWMDTALKAGPLVIEPWLERELDFSVQMEMGPSRLELQGYAGLINDLKGQYQANWAETGYARCLPAKVGSLLGLLRDEQRILVNLYHEVVSLLEPKLRRIGFVGPVSIDALVYRTAQGSCRLKPIVEINPRYTMGRLTIELMKQVSPGGGGLFRLVSNTQLRAAGLATFADYARVLSRRLPLHLDEGIKVREGGICLNDPAQASVCLATFEVNPRPVFEESFGSEQAVIRR